MTSLRQAAQTTMTTSGKSTSLRSYTQKSTCKKEPLIRTFPMPAVVEGPQTSCWEANWKNGRGGFGSHRAIHLYPDSHVGPAISRACGTCRSPARGPRHGAPMLWQTPERHPPQPDIYRRYEIPMGSYERNQHLEACLLRRPFRRCPVRRSRVVYLHPGPRHDILERN